MTINTMDQLKKIADEDLLNRKKEALKGIANAIRILESVKKDINHGYPVCVSNIVANIFANFSNVDRYSNSLSKATIVNAAVIIHNHGEKQ